MILPPFQLNKLNDFHPSTIIKIGYIALLCHKIRAKYFIRISKGYNFNLENELKFKMS